MANTVLWNDPDTQQGVGNNSQVEATYIISPSTKKALDFNPFAEIAGQPAGSVTGITTDLFPSFDMSAYSFAILQLSGTWTMTLQAQWSNDNFATAPVASETQTIGAASSSTTITANGMYVIPKAGRYLRIRPSVWTSNASCVGLLECYTQISPQLLSSVLASQSGTWTIQPGNTQNTTPWLIQGPTNTFTQAANTAGNVIGKASAGALWTATITTLGTAGLDIFDNASTNSGTKLLSIPASAAVGTIYAFPAGEPAANGIVSAGVANCPGVTFSFR